MNKAYFLLSTIYLDPELKAKAIGHNDHDPGIPRGIDCKIPNPMHLLMKLTPKDTNAKNCSGSVGPSIIRPSLA